MPVPNPAPILVALGALFWASAAAAAPDAPSLAVEVEITDRAADAPARQALSVTLTLAGERDCSSASVRHRDGESYDVHVCRTGDVPGLVGLSFEIRRRASIDGRMTTQQFKPRLQMALGKPVVIAQLLQADKSKTVLRAHVEPVGGPEN
jgi:hypothetical protein